MFNIEDIHLDGNLDFNFVNNKVEEIINGLSYYGNGSMARVYGRVYDPYVYKIIHDNDIGYFNYLREIKKANSNNPFLPKIFSVVMYKFLGKPVRTIVKMEKLNNFGWDNPAYEEINRLSKMIEKNRPVSIFQPLQRRKDLYELREIVRNAMDTDDIRLDLHAGNWMLRGEHQLVLIDPLI